MIKKPNQVTLFFRDGVIHSEYGLVGNVAVIESSYESKNMLVKVNFNEVSKYQRDFIKRDIQNLCPEAKVKFTNSQNY